MFDQYKVRSLTSGENYMYAKRLLRPGAVLNPRYAEKDRSVYVEGYIRPSSAPAGAEVFTCVIVTEDGGAVLYPARDQGPAHSLTPEEAALLLYFVQNRPSIPRITFPASPGTPVTEDALSPESLDMDTFSAAGEPELPSGRTMTPKRPGRSTRETAAKSLWEVLRTPGNGLASPAPLFRLIPRIQIRDHRCILALLLELPDGSVIVVDDLLAWSECCAHGLAYSCGRQKIRRLLPGPGTMSPESGRLQRFVDRCLEARSLLSPGGQAPYPGRLFLTPGETDELVRLSASLGIPLRTEECQRLELAEADLPPSVSCSLKSNPADSRKVLFSLDTGGMAFAPGFERLYGLKGGVLYCFSRERLGETACALLSRGACFCFDADTLPLFFHRVYPVLTAMGIHADIPEALGRRQVPSPSFVLTLSMDAPEEIRFTLEAVYPGDPVRSYALLPERSYEEALKLSENRDTASRIPEEERRIKAIVAACILDPRDGRIPATEENLITLLTETLPTLSSIVTVKREGGLSGIRVIEQPIERASVSLAEETIDIELDTGDVPLARLYDIVRAFPQPQKYYRLPGGSILFMDALMHRQLEFLQENLQPGSDESRVRLRLPLYRIYNVLEQRRHMPFPVTAEPAFEAFSEALTSPAKAEAPEGLTLPLSPCQREALSWLYPRCRARFGVLLADEIGLDKPLEVISLLAKLREDGEKAPFLIAADTAMLGHWTAMVLRCAPALLCCTVAGPGNERTMLLTSLTQGTGPRPDVLITSHEALSRDISYYAQLSFGVFILDEAGSIKNRTSEKSRAAKQVTASFRIALTDSDPSQHLQDLWNIFDFLMPGFLFSYTRYRRMLQDAPDGPGQIRGMIEPFVLRRTRDQVFPDRQPPLVKELFVALTGDQKNLYLREQKALLDDFAGPGTGRMDIADRLERLRMICCDPTLLDRRRRDDQQKKYSFRASAKRDAVFCLLRRCLESGHQAALLSRYPGVLQRFDRELADAHIPHLVMDARMTDKERAALIRQYREKKASVLLADLQGGIYPLYTAGADVIIHFDLWWSEDAGREMLERLRQSSRRGPVLICRLVAGGTLEENLERLRGRSPALYEFLSAGADGPVPCTGEDLQTLLAPDA